MNKKILNMLLLTAAMLPVTTTAAAQNGRMSVEGTSYYLPKTSLHFTLKIEKTTYTPGDLAPYAARYLKRGDISLDATTTYRILGIKLSSEAVPDTSKFFTVKADSKHSIRTIERDDNGVLLAINAKPRKIQPAKPFISAPKPKAINPRDYMTEEILRAGSEAKMAELCVQEIYDIRENKGLLNKGQADFMPKDGEQLRIMINNLDTQEHALMQLFEGVTEKDTSEIQINFVPTREVERQLLFRFSKKTGMTDADDLGGNPYYISIEDLHSMPTLSGGIDEGKKDNVGIYVNLPGKIRASIFSGTDLMAAFELYAAQFGDTESISGEMFGKKYTTSLVLNPVTGSVENINTESLK